MRRISLYKITVGTPNNIKQIIMFGVEQLIQLYPNRLLTTMPSTNSLRTVYHIKEPPPTSPMQRALMTDVALLIVAVHEAATEGGYGDTTSLQAASITMQSSHNRFGQCDATICLLVLRFSSRIASSARSDHGVYGSVWWT
jgi:hypothetical protein